MRVTHLLIGINVLAYLWQLATGGGPDYDHGYLVGRLVVEHGEWWRIVTAAFLHGSLMHIGFNMLALAQVGTLVEGIMGRGRYVVLYALCIVGSGLTVVHFNYDQATLGASGAIFGLFGALVAIGLSLPPRGMSIVTQTLPIIGINLAFGFAVPGISNAAHVGGLLTGFVAGWLLFAVPSRARERADAAVNGRYAPVAAGGAVPFDPAAERVETIEQQRP